MLATIKSNLLALADRCEREEPSKLLDAYIGPAVGAAPKLKTIYKRGEYRGNKRVVSRLEQIWAPYTSSLDAAVTLMPDGQWGVNWDIESVFAKGFEGNVAICVYVWLGHPTNVDTFIRSPGCATYADGMKWLPRLICAAALRARAQEIE